MSARVFIWEQHLLGLGHFVRARLIAEALRDANFQVTLVTGGTVPVNGHPTGMNFVQLPSVRAKDENFDEIVDGAGQPVTLTSLEARRDQLLAAFQLSNPSILITETFPFGRRLLDFELMALMDCATHLPVRPKLLCSVRDVLQRPKKNLRAQSMIDRARSFFDGILVHGDPELIRLEQSFPEVSQVSELCHYTGYVCKAQAPYLGKRTEILVSAGGGAAGKALVDVARHAKSLSRYRNTQWTIVAGPLSEGVALCAENGLDVVKHLPDFQARLSRAAVSVSQAGYNTISEALCAKTPTVAVPFETEREKEQSIRARLLAEKGLLTLLRVDELSPESLAAAIDRAAERDMPSHGVNMDGQAGTVRCVTSFIAQ